MLLSKFSADLVVYRSSSESRLHDTSYHSASLKLQHLVDIIQHVS